MIKRLGHHDTAFFDLARHQEFRCQRGRDAGLHFGERATELLVHLAMVVHGVDEIFDPFPVLGAAHLGANAGVAVHRRAELRGLGQVGAGHAHRGDFNAIHLHLFPGVEVEQGQRSSQVDDLVRERVFEDGIIDSLFHEGRIGAQTHTFLVRHGISLHQADRLGKTHPIHFGFQLLAGGHAPLLHVVGDRAQFLE